MGLISAGYYYYASRKGVAVETYYSSSFFRRMGRIDTVINSLLSLGGFALASLYSKEEISKSARIKFLVTGFGSLLSGATFYIINAYYLFPKIQDVQTRILQLNSIEVINNGTASFATDCVGKIEALIDKITNNLKLFNPQINEKSEVPVISKSEALNSIKVDWELLLEQMELLSDLRQQRAIKIKAYQTIVDSFLDLSKNIGLIFRE